MNKKVYVTKNQAIVEDENRNDREIDNVHNLKNILIEENVVETLENKKQELEDNMPKDKENLEDRKKKHSMVKKTSTILAVAFPIIILIISKLIPVFENAYYLDTKMIFLESLFFAGGFFAMANISILASDSDFIKKEEKRIRGNEVMLQCIEKDLVKEKEKLDRFNTEKVLVEGKVDSIEVISIDDSQIMHDLESKLNFYYNMGFNYDRLLKLYKDGELSNLYKDSELDEIENYIENHNDEKTLKMTYNNRNVK